MVELNHAHGQLLLIMRVRNSYIIRFLIPEACAEQVAIRIL